MRAAVTPAPMGQIAISEVPDPERRLGEIIVRVHAASVNWLDRAVYEGTAMGDAASFPLVQGIGAAGVVETGMGPYPAGMRVVVKPTIACRRCRWCRQGRLADCIDATTFGIHRQGGFADLLAVPRSNLLPLPEGVSLVEAAAAAHTHPIALRMLRSVGAPIRRATVMVTGAGGTLGTAAAQLASILGANVIAVANSDQAQDIGASEVVDESLRGPAFKEAIWESTDGVGVDVVIETTGSAAMVEDGMAVLARGGAMVLAAARPNSRLTLDLPSLYRNGHRVIGISESSQVEMSDAFGMLAEHDIHPVVSARYPLDRTQAAMNATLDRDRIGNIVIQMNDEG